MGILEFIAIAALLGFGAYCLITYIPMAQPIQKIIVFAVVAFLVLILLSATGLLHLDMQIPRVR